MGGSTMVPSIILLSLSCVAASVVAGATRSNLTVEAQTSQLREREETTEKSAPQVVSYIPTTSTRGLVYPSTTYNPSQYNPNTIYQNRIYPTNSIPYDSSNPASNPAYNPSVVPTLYYPNRFYTATTNGGGYLGNGVTEAFTVRRASPYVRAGSKVVFTETVTQTGTGWNTARSEFVATTAGLFFFTFSAVSDRYSHFRVSLKKNEQDVVSAFGDASGYQMGSQSALVSLSPGDRVYLQLQEGQLREAAASSRAYTSFTGFRIL
ncbi:cerebellin-3-like [Macrobrachium rosenbergii]|uniref:cerebellin-3-like n=1 Tax=Macrobrachium rosenbergii TaxID=79674 RepID=UPI0034D5EE77